MPAICAKLLPFLWLLSWAVPSGHAHIVHPLHVSTTEIGFNPKTKSLEISCRIFTDDFEQILAKNYKTKIDLSRADMQKAMDVVVRKYMDTHLSFMVNGKGVKAGYIGFEIDHEATNVYLEIENIQALQNLTLHNSLLYDLFDDQMNILHVENRGSRKSAKTEYPAAQLKIAF